MKISNNIIFTENPQRNDFVKNVVLNSARVVLEDNKKLAFLPSGSWMTDSGYDCSLSDHDLTILVPDASYQKMEEEICTTKRALKEIVCKRLEAHKIPEKAIYDRILPSINIFPTPRVQNCFDSYSQFREYTNLNINLIPNGEDTDKGLWQMKGMMTKHFENEGRLIYLENDGALKNIAIKRNKKQFYRYMEQKDIHMPSAEPFYLTQKIKILNEFIELLNTNKGISPRAFFKYLQRVQKFFFADTQNDIFMVANDINKKDSVKYKKIVEEENLFKSQSAKIIENFRTSKLSKQPFISEQYEKKMLENLKRFQEISLELLKRPVLRGFRG